MARKNKEYIYYDEKYVAKIDEYLKMRQDEELSFQKVKVKLPTIEGFADYINVERKTLYNWEKDHPGFAKALEKIRQEQLQRLIDRGLEGSYNPTIAKLILSANHGMRERTDITTDDKPLPLLDYTQKTGESNIDSE